jgi:hypothetical protein
VTSIDTDAGASDRAQTQRARGPDDGADGDRPGRDELVLRFVTSVPDRLLVMFLWGAIAVTAALLLRVFQPAVVVPLALVLIVATWKLAPRPIRADQASAAGAALALALAVAWILLNRRYDSTMLSVYRDPAIFALRGWWLVHHSSPNIPVGSANIAAKGLTGAQVATGGFPVINGAFQAQGNSLVPGLIAIGGWVGGYSILLASNLVYGGLGLLGVYALGRRLMGPLWALAPMAALAASMPMVVFSRAPYTEPVALIMVMGGLTVLWSAWETRRWALFLLAGLFVGGSSLARPDGGVAVLGASAAIVVVAVLAVNPATRARARLYLLAFAVGAIAMMAAGYIDLRIDSSAYLRSTPQAKSLLEAVPVVIVVGLALSWFGGLDTVRRWLLRARRGVAVGLAAAAVLASIVMISRPAWWVAHHTPLLDQPQMAARQAGEHLQIDPSRSYDERTMDWLAWYFEWPTVLLGCAGGALLVWVSARRRDFRPLLIVGTAGAVAALYLNDVSIFPDQIWGTRRFLPVVIPLMLIAAVYATRAFARRFVPWSWLGVGAAGLVAVLPLYTWGIMFPQVEGLGQPLEVSATCQAVAGAGRAVLAGTPLPGGSRLPTLRIICGVSVVAITAPTPATLQALWMSWGRGRIAVISGESAAIPWAGSPPDPYWQGTYGLWQESIQHRPRAPQYIAADRVYAGVIQPDGRVRPIPPPAS